MKINPIVTPAPKAMPIAKIPQKIPVKNNAKNLEKLYNQSRGIGNKIDIEA